MVVFPGEVPFRASQVLSFVLENRSSGFLPLEMDGTGVPVNLTTITDAENKKVWKRTPSYDLAPLPTPKDEIYQVPPKEKIRLSLDIGKEFNFDAFKPGTYTLEFRAAGATILRLSFDAVDYRTVQSRQIQGAYEPPQFGELQGNAKAAVQLSIIESVGLEKPKQWLLIDQIVAINERRNRLPSYSFPITVGDTVDKAEMDNLGQVWVVLKSGDKQSLLVWQMHQLAWKVLVPLTKEKITLGTTRARMFISKQNAIIAGVEGKPKMTTRSVWAGEDASAQTVPEPPKAPAGPATKPAN